MPSVVVFVIFVVCKTVHRVYWKASTNCCYREGDKYRGLIVFNLFQHLILSSHSIGTIRTALIYIFVCVIIKLVKKTLRHLFRWWIDNKCRWSLIFFFFFVTTMIIVTYNKTRIMYPYRLKDISIESRRIR